MQLSINPNTLTFDKMKAYASLFPEAGRMALNRMAQMSRTQASTLVRERYNVKKMDVDPHMRTRNADVKNLQSKLVVSGRKIRLEKFGAKGAIPPNKGRRRKSGSTGVSVEVVRGRRRILAGSFRTYIKAGNKSVSGVFMRKGKERLPIEQKYGPGVQQMFGSTSVYTKLVRYVEAHLPKLLADAVKFKRA